MADRKITREVLEAALNGDWEPIKSLPKTDLHAHLLLSAPFTAYENLIDGNIRPPPERFRNLDHFLEYVKQEFFPIFTDIDSYRTIIHSAFRHMIEDGVVFTEASYDISMPLLIDKRWQDVAKIFQEEIAEVRSQLIVFPDLGLARDFPLPGWPALVEEALATDFFKGIDLYGAELLKPIQEFAEFFQAARAKDLKIKMHCGETGSPARMLEEISFVEPLALQHGVRASEDRELMSQIASSGMEVNVCPMSNYRLSVVQEYSEHPIGEMLRSGIKVTLNTDDLAVFQRSLSEEYVHLYSSGILTPIELEQLRQNGLSVMSRRTRR
ncbi:MAG: hypothetical protein KDD42_02900 [Bdellovibrionales bacterium]|nr:hypothetical protein [Bdellovibrionales bacterium]